MEQRAHMDLGPGADFAANLVIITRNLGQLILHINNLEDMACDNMKHDGGNDIARKIGSSWKIFMDLKPADVDYPLKDDLARDQLRTKVIWDKLGNKRRNGEKLTDDESAELEEAKAIGIKYLPDIAKVMKARLSDYYKWAKFALESIRERKPIDKGNLILIDFFKQYIDGLWNKIDKYANP